MVIVFKPAKIAFYLLIISTVLIAIFFLLRDYTSAEQEVSSGLRGFVLIIDAGHGGEDGGAVSITGACESEINLAIALKMRELAALTATPCILTRESEEIDYGDSAGSIAQKKVYDQRQRVELIEGVPGAILISIHQNKYPTPQPRGPQAFYGADDLSPQLAAAAQEALNAALYPENRRVAAPVPRSVYLFKSVSCPSLLAECGFLSHSEEARLLETDNHQLKAALALMCAYLQFINAQAQPS